VLNSSEFDDGTGKLLRARTWHKAPALPKGQVVKPGYPGVYSGTRRKGNIFPLFFHFTNPFF